MYIHIAVYFGYTCAGIVFAIPRGQRVALAGAHLVVIHAASVVEIGELTQQVIVQGVCIQILFGAVVA